MKRNLFTYEAEKETAKRIKLYIEGTTQEYALNFLNIFNHCREYPDVFYEVRNNAGNDVFVTYNPEREDDVIEYLQELGEIVWNKTVRRWVIYVDYEANDFDTVHDLDATTFCVKVD